MSTAKRFAWLDGISTVGVCGAALILGGNLASYALLLTLVAVLTVRVAVDSLAKRAPFSQRVLLLGGGPLAARPAQQIRTRPDLAFRLVLAGRIRGVTIERGDPRLRAAVPPHQVPHEFVLSGKRPG